LRTGAVEIQAERTADTALNGSLIYEILGPSVSEQHSPVAISHGVCISVIDAEDTGIAAYNPGAAVPVSGANVSGSLFVSLSFWTTDFALCPTAADSIRFYLTVSSEQANNRRNQCLTRSSTQWFDPEPEEALFTVVKLGTPK
jgi:hypothetical protein